jgi:hypothetical protein
MIPRENLWIRRLGAGPDGSIIDNLKVTFITRKQTSAELMLPSVRTTTAPKK